MNDWGIMGRGLSTGVSGDEDTVLGEDMVVLDSVEDTAVGVEVDTVFAVDDDGIFEDVTVGNDLLSMLCGSLDVEGSTDRSVLLNGFTIGVFDLPEFDADDGAAGALAGAGDGLAAATTDALARFIAASAAFFRAAAESTIDVDEARVVAGAGAGEAREDEAADVEALVVHLWFAGKRCSAQNC